MRLINLVQVSLFGSTLCHMETFLEIEVQQLSFIMDHQILYSIRFSCCLFCPFK